MVQGTLHVLLVSAKGLDNADFLGNMDPYAVLICRSQEQKSSIASGAGNEPEWNETFVFTVSDSTTDLTIKLFDKDTFSSDDFVGEAKILLDTVFAEGNLPPTVYNVVKDQEYRGEIKVGFTFTPSEDRSLDFGEEELGGWKQSSLQ
ncbi:elicitor-responsive protein 3-like [Curcuma longa]|uniref:elicitor-responsive protein 3-like n=2 Tax=Curcuma longa TaxID=136217 RepID=UPI003D9DE5F7